MTLDEACDIADACDRDVTWWSATLGLVLGIPFILWALSQGGDPVVAYLLSLIPALTPVALRGPLFDRWLSPSAEAATGLTLEELRAVRDCPVEEDLDLRVALNRALGSYSEAQLVLRDSAWGPLLEQVQAHVEPLRRSFAELLERLAQVATTRARMRGLEAVTAARADLRERLAEANERLTNHVQEITAAFQGMSVQLIEVLVEHQSGLAAPEAAHLLTGMADSLRQLQEGLAETEEVGRLMGEEEVEELLRVRREA
jgi:hypothetical protein